MQTTSFASDQSPHPWSGVAAYQNYSPHDSMAIEDGVRAMLEGPANPYLLIPLTPAANGGVQYYAGIVRDSSDERSLKIAQYRLDLVPSGEWVIRQRSISTPGTVRNAFPHIDFRTGQFDEVDNKGLFWDVLREGSVSMYLKISLSSPHRHTYVGGTRLAYDLRRDAWTLNPSPGDQADYHPFVLTRLEISLREMCVSQRPVLLVYTPRNDEHLVVIHRSGPTTFNLVDIRMVAYPDPRVSERMVIIRPALVQMFPGFQLTSVRLTNADKASIFQEPVLRHYQALKEKHDQGPRRLAIAMSLHRRLGAMAGCIGNIGRDLIVAIANM